jgi:hypothetical protein
MILKASQRGGGQNLAVHLMRTDDNEHISLHELRGFASDNLKDAFKEAEAISLGTKCQQYLFSLSLSPPEQASVSEKQFENAIDRIEERLGLEGQPRAIVFHEKEGRRHAHCVWSRIDAETMTARQLSFFKMKLMGISRDLYLEHGWQMPRGITSAGQRDPLNFTLAEWQQAKRQGVDPRSIKETLQACWNGSDNLRSFQSSLQERGFFLAKGDKRGHVVLDHAGEVYSLPRMLDLKTKDVRARLGDGNDLRSVEATKAEIGQKMTQAIRCHVAESRAQFQKRSSKLGEYKQEMTLLHREARSALAFRQQTEWQAENRERAARLPKGLRGLWHRITGQYQEVRRQNEDEARRTGERHAEERQNLIEQQLAQRAILQAEFKKLRKSQAQQLLELRQEIGRYLKFSRGDPSPARERDIGLRLKLEP